MTPLHGPSIRLRPPVPADYPTLYSWFSDPEVVAPYDRFVSETYEGFVHSMSDSIDDPTSLVPRFVVERVDAPGPLGVVGYFSPHPVLESIEVWYIMGDRAARGHGFGREAVGVLTDHLFRTTSVERVGATCDVENVASARLVEGLGFRREGTLRGAFYHHGRWHDVFLFGITRGERLPPVAPG
ncbi:MAG: GNAT family N-acetyltransferase [Thermoplasmata archaeon]|nr:GNAT family N-acetyltransferase [Thermoplasmata archaeon]